MPVILSREELKQDIILPQMEGRWWTGWDGGNDPRHLPTLSRGNYLCPTVERVRRVLNWSKTDEQDRMDAYKCAAFAAQLFADFRRYGRFTWMGMKYPFAAGFMWSGHALNWCVTHDGKLRIIEPQTDWLMLPQPKEIRPGHWGVWVMVG
jgi:hypothetical protein